MYYNTVVPFQTQPHPKIIVLAILHLSGFGRYENCSYQRAFELAASQLHQSSDKRARRGHPDHHTILFRGGCRVFESLHKIMGTALVRVR
jgi:hypothetical protein